jgi:hypothetical protein
LDLILIFTLLGFLSAVALCLYLHRAYTPHGPAMKSEKIRRKK